MQNKTLILKTLFLGFLLVFLNQCSGDHAMFDFPGAIIPVDGDLNDVPDSGDGGNSGTITGNPTNGFDPSITPDAGGDGAGIINVPADQPVTDDTDSNADGVDDSEDVEDVVDENGEEIDGDDQTTIPDDFVEVDSPGWEDSGPHEGDDDTDVYPGAGPDDEEAVELDFTTDTDGDGLAAAIDPRPTIADMWGFLDGGDMSLVCTYEQSGYTYHYIEGDKPNIIVGQIPDNKSILSDKTYRKPSITVKVQVLPPVNAFGVEYNNGILVGGLVERDEARLPTVNCMGGDYDFTYGLYVRIRDLQVTLKNTK